MKIVLNSNKPIFQQIADQISNYIDLGIFEINQKLPSVRAMAVEIGVNPNTVAKAYDLLLDNNKIYTLEKKGYYVNASDQSVSVVNGLKNSLFDLISLAKSEKIDREYLESIIRKEIGDIYD